tara:strand:+ start:88 stop:576 length:489 start_codon:yes stop_codon:yes gene_type:complete
MENEIWKQCGESEIRFYEVSNMGNTKSITKINKIEKLLKPFADRNGYLQIRINNKTITIHSLVAYVFIGERPHKMQIDHIDRNKQNNRLDNLRYCTRSENNRNRDVYRSDILEQDPKERLRIMKNGYQKFKINCPCGSITNKSDKTRHEKTEKHKKYLNTLL